MWDNPLYASNANMRMACPGSHQLENLSFARKIDLYAEAELEGTTAHWVANEFLKTGVMPAVGSTTVLKTLVTQEMVAGAKLWYLEIYSLNPTALFIEQAISLEDIDPNYKGIPDCWALIDGTLHVWEYKFGHAKVEAFENYQLLSYAFGAYMMQDIVEGISLHVIAPRLFSDKKIDRWDLSVEELLVYIDKLKANCKQAKSKSPPPPCRVSKYCKHCRANAICSTLQNSAIQNVEGFEKLKAEEQTEETLGPELRYLKHAQRVLESRITGLEAQADATLRAGNRVRHFHLELNPGKLAWDKSTDEILMMAELEGVNLKKPDVLITPTQAMNDAGMSKEIVESLASRTSSLKLAELNTADYTKIFNQKTKGK